MAESYQLFQYDSCPFCYRVQAFLAGKGLELPVRDILKDPQARRELIQGGGRSTVPCLRIERDGQIDWLYESHDIIRYLDARTAS